MIQNKTEIRVRYADTDQMNIVYNGKYFEYFEVGRTEMLRSINLIYKDIEEKGFLLPVIECYAKYISPAFYDEILIIESQLLKIPQIKIHIDYKIYRKNQNQLITEGYTVHTFVNKKTNKAVRIPEFFNEAIKQYFQE